MRNGLMVLWLLWTVSLRAQFFVNGQASVLNDTCYQLTPAVNNAVGSVWNAAKINLLESFEVVIRVNLGCKDQDGADGMVFGFQPISTSIGTSGGGMGFANIVPSLGIEIDCFQNTNFGDPPFDHIAITKNGQVNHNAGVLAGPVQASATAPNIEDCNFHDMRVSWNADAKRLQVFFDCQLRLSYTGDIVNDIFNGDPRVYWGFTAATGALNNVHQLCFNYTSFLDQLDDVTMCPGGRYPLQARGGVSYRWSPEAGLSNPNIPNPIATPAVTTTYALEMLDACNRPFFDTITITVLGDTLLIDIDADSILCDQTTARLDVETPGARYRWNTNDTTGHITVSTPGYYAVTVSLDNPYCISTDHILLTGKPQPQASLGPDTSLCQGQSILYRVSFPEASYRWQDDNPSDSIRITTPGLYTVEVSNYCGTAYDAVRVSFENCREVFFPSAFSPNNDGINDTFSPLHGGDVVSVQDFQIYDRWGGLVYTWAEQEEPWPRWNGKTKDKPLPAGLYVYTCSLTFRDGHVARFHGEINLLR
jgi:gliding motility-associated-like protein